MRFLILNQEKNFSNFIYNYLARLAIIDIAYDLNSLMDQFYLYDYDAIILNQSLDNEKYELKEIISEIRTEQFGKSDLQTVNEKQILLGSLFFDPIKDFFYTKESILELSKKEHLLLRFLLLNKQQYFSKEQLAHKIINKVYDRKSNLVDVYIYRLRKILEKNLTNISIINRKNFGYKITACADS